MLSSIYTSQHSHLVRDEINSIINPCRFVMLKSVFLSGILCQSVFHVSCGMTPSTTARYKYYCKPMTC